MIFLGSAVLVLHLCGDANRSGAMIRTGTWDH